MVLIEAAQSITPGKIILPINAFYELGISSEDLELTLRAAETHALLDVSYFETASTFFVSVRNWSEYRLI